MAWWRDCFFSCLFLGKNKKSTTNSAKIHVMASFYVDKCEQQHFKEKPNTEEKHIYRRLTAARLICAVQPVWCGSGVEPLSTRLAAEPDYQPRVTKGPYQPRRRDGATPADSYKAGTTSS